MRILLAVTGSISAYKALDLCRIFVKEGHQVKVVLTKSGTKIVNPDVFIYLGAIDVYLASDDFNVNKRGGNQFSQINHIELAKWCDQMIIAPCSANVLAKLSVGIADDLLTTTYLSINNKPIIISPAMNVVMLNHVTTQNHIRILENRINHTLIPPDSGLLACGDTGEGKLPQVEKIALIANIIGNGKEQVQIKEQKKFLITTGATIAPIDPIRYLTNGSSGMTGFILAKQLLAKGHQVTVLAGMMATKQLDDLKLFPNFKIERVVTTTELFNLVKKLFKNCHYYISAAAPVDYEFEYQNEKIKKDKMALPKIHLAPDILSYVVSNRQKNQKIVGFSGESKIDFNILNEKWKKKKVDLLIGNAVHHGLSGNNSIQKGFGINSNEYTFFINGKIIETIKLTKEELAEKIYQFCLKR